MLQPKISLAVIVNSFPKLSETFILNKALGLTQAGVNVTVITNSKKIDFGIFNDSFFQIHSLMVKTTLISRGFLGIMIGLLRISFTKPLKALKLLNQASRLYPKNLKRVFKAWVLALPLKLGNFDIIHFEFSGLAVTYLDALPLLKDSKLLISCRGTAERIVPIIDPSRGEQLCKALNEVDRVHCVSFEMVQTLSEYNLEPEKAFVNYPAIDPERFQRSTAYEKKTGGPYRLISVGRLDWVKGIEFGLLTIRELLDRGYNVVYDLLGGGEEEEKLRFMVHDLRLSNHVHFHGRQPAQQVQQMYENADICLLPSLSEGLSNVALEAMEMELPVVSTFVGGMGEVITDGVEGFLVPPYQPKIMAEKAALLIDDPELRIMMGKAGRRRVEMGFSLEGQTKKFHAIYNSLFEKLS